MYFIVTLLSSNEYTTNSDTHCLAWQQHEGQMSANHGHVL